MATINFNVQDISGVVFKPISSKRKRSNKSAKVAPAISYEEEYIAPKASYPQVPMFERWSNDCKSVKVVSCVAPFEQVPMHERWNW